MFAGRCRSSTRIPFGLLLALAGATVATPSEADCRLTARQVLQLSLLGEYRFLVPSTSMVPTLPLRSTVAVRPLDGPVRRGDVVAVCPESDGSTIYLKRVVGLGGDRIGMVGNRLVLNGDPVARDRLPDHRYNDDLRDRSLECWRETVEGRSWRACVDPVGSPLADTPEVTVPSGRLFLLGDNRDNSADSRTASLGLVPLENVIGRAEDRIAGAGVVPEKAD